LECILLLFKNFQYIDRARNLKIIERIRKLHKDEYDNIHVNIFFTFWTHQVKFSVFLVYSSRSFDKCTQLCNYHHNQDTEQFHLLIPLTKFLCVALFFFLRWGLGKLPKLLFNSPRHNWSSCLQPLEQLGLQTHHWTWLCVTSL
jgi:hypothetical protein